VKKILITGLLAVILVVLPILSACGGSSTSGAQKTLTIGAIGFLTGPASQGGIAFQQGCEMAVAKYNDAGGLKVGSDTYHINLIVLDDKMSVDQATTDATKLVQENKATIVIGPLIPNYKTAILPILQQSNVLLGITDGVNCSIPYPNSPDVKTSEPLVIRTAYACNEAIGPILDYLKKTYPNVKNVAACGVVEDAEDPLVTGKGGWDDNLKSRGLSRVGDLETFAPDIADFGPVVAKILANKPDAIGMTISTPITFGLCVKAARSLGFTGPMFFDTHLDIDNQAKLSGDPNVSDIFGTGLTLADTTSLTPAIKDAIAKYNTMFDPKDLISDVLLVGYNGLDVLLQTIVKAKSIDNATIVKTFEGLTKSGDLQTLWGPGFVGGIKTLGVNRVLNYPYYLQKTDKGVSTNFQTIQISVP